MAKMGTTACQAWCCGSVAVSCRGSCCGCGGVVRCCSGLFWLSVAVGGCWVLCGSSVALWVLYAVTLCTWSRCTLCMGGCAVHGCMLSCCGAVSVSVSLCWSLSLLVVLWVVFLLWCCVHGLGISTRKKTCH